MGHIEPDGTPAEQDEIDLPPGSGPRPPRTLESGLWPVWRRLTGLFSSWSLPFSGLFTPGAWTSVGNDFLSGFRRNWSTDKAFALTRDLSDEQLLALADMAALNLRRHEAVVRVVLVTYATVPITILALIAEVSSDGLLSFVSDNFVSVAQLMGVLFLAVLLYFMGAWRARQMVSVLELIRIERGFQGQPQ